MTNGVFDIAIFDPQIFNVGVSNPQIFDVVIFDPQIFDTGTTETSMPITSPMLMLLRSGKTGYRKLYIRGRVKNNE